MDEVEVEVEGASHKVEEERKSSTVLFSPALVTDSTAVKVIELGQRKVRGEEKSIGHCKIESDKRD